MIVTGAYVAAFRGDARTTRRLAMAATRASYEGRPPDGTVSYESAVAILLAVLGLDGVTDALKQAELASRLEPPESPWHPLIVAIVGVTKAALGANAAARVALTEAARSPSGPDGIATYAMGQLALLEAAEGRWDEAAEVALRACDLIEKLDIQDILSSGAAYAAAAAVAAHNGDVGLTQQRLRSITAIQDRLSDAIPFDAFQIHLVVAETYLAIGDLSSAEVHARQAAARLEALGDGGVLASRLEA